MKNTLCTLAITIFIVSTAPGLVMIYMGIGGYQFTFSQVMSSLVLSGIGNILAGILTTAASETRS